MCVSYTTVSCQLAFDFFRTPLEESADWRDEIYQDYRAPFIVHGGDGRREGLLGSYGFVPQKRKPEGMARMTTMNAKAETIAELRSFQRHWAAGQLCLVPMTRFFEPNYEKGRHERWAVEMADGMPFAVAGMYRPWVEEDGSIVHSFTQITVAADEHALMRRLHRPEEAKRSLVVVPESDYDAWLACKNPQLARTFLNLYPAELMRGVPAPATAPSPQFELF